jgi:hypothetical protein
VYKAMADSYLHRNRPFCFVKKPGISWPAVHALASPERVGCLFSHICCYLLKSFWQKVQNISFIENFVSSQNISECTSTFKMLVKSHLNSRPTLRRYFHLTSDPTFILPTENYNKETNFLPANPETLNQLYLSLPLDVALGQFHPHILNKLL